MAHSVLAASALVRATPKACLGVAVRCRPHLAFESPLRRGNSVADTGACLWVALAVLHNADAAKFALVPDIANALPFLTRTVVPAVVRAVLVLTSAASPLRGAHAFSLHALALLLALVAVHGTPFVAAIIAGKAREAGHRAVVLDETLVLAYETRRARRSGPALVALARGLLCFGTRYGESFRIVATATVPVASRVGFANWTRAVVAAPPILAEAGAIAALPESMFVEAVFRACESVAVLAFETHVADTRAVAVTRAMA